MRKLLAVVFFLAFLTLSSGTYAQEFDLDKFTDESSNASKTFNPDDWKVPENATIDELFALHDKMSDQDTPEFDDDADLLVAGKTISSFETELADKILAFGDELTREQFEKAVTMKVQAMLLAAAIDDETLRDLNAFVNDLLRKASNEDEVLFVVKQKFVILNDVGTDKRVRNLADSALARPEPKVQSFGVAIRLPVGRLFLTRLFDMDVVDFEDGDLDFDIDGLNDDEDTPEESLAKSLEFYESVINDPKRDKSVRETAMELKLGVLLLEAERTGIDGENEDGSYDLDEDFDYYEEEAEAYEKGDEYFFACLDQDMSVDARKFFYELWLWESMPKYDPDETDETHARREKILAKLAKEEDRELRDQVFYYNAHRLLDKADYLEDEATAMEMDAYAKKVLAGIDPEDSDRVPHAVVLNAKAALIREQYDRVVELIDDYFANYDDTTEHSLEELTELKVDALAELVKKDPDKYDDYAAFVDDLIEKDDDVRASMIIAARTVGVLEKIADEEGSLDDFNKAIETFKDDFRKCPWCYDAYTDASDSIKKIGEINDKPDLYKTTAEEIVEIGENSNDRIARICASLLKASVSYDEDDEDGYYDEEDEDENFFDDEEKEDDSVDLDGVFE
ncbi:MAG: hypothetical protein IKX88_16725 [Thermoguttaceae bacterium]|nr:hypothetical protein [Thermoguttaceae bacterium]